MAKPGKPSHVGAGTDPGGTRLRLVTAAVETLRVDGFAGASARTIARRAGCNQGLVFYHFGTVVNLLLAALDRTSEERMVRYTAAVAAASGAADLIAVAGDIYREDLDHGHIAVLAEMIAGASTVPGLATEVAARIDPWIDFAESAITGVIGTGPLAQIVAPRDAAYAVVALYLGVEMLSHLGGDRTQTERLIGALGNVSGLVTMFSPS